MVAANFTEDQVNVMCGGMEALPSDTAMDLMSAVDCTSYFMGSGMVSNLVYLILHILCHS